MLTDIILTASWIILSAIVWKCLNVKKLDHVGQNRVEYFRRNLK